MSFAEFLKGRISEDYKNLIIQKLEEVKGQTEVLRNTLTPSLLEMNRSLRTTLQQELERIQQVLDNELKSSQESISSQINTLFDDNVESWYYSDISRFEQQLEILISDIVSNIPVPAKNQNVDLESLAELVRQLDQGNTQSEILNIVLHQIAGWVDRAVLFVIRGEQASGWAALGLGTDWDSNRVRQLKVDLSKETILRTVITTGAEAHGSADEYPDNGELFLMIGSSFPRFAFACPVMVRGKIAGILYADIQEELTERPDLPNLLYIASRAAGFAIDQLPLKPKVAAPAPKIVQAPVETAPKPVTAPEYPPQEYTAPAVEDEVEEAVVEEVEEAEEVEPEEESSATVMMPAAPAILSEEDQRLHDDAKRFARLLVSEIKLYNEAQVAAGREHKDLYDRLKDDIERSRRMYVERVPTHIHSTTNYFYEELVRTLANGNPILLGM